MKRRHAVAVVVCVLLAGAANAAAAPKTPPPRTVKVAYDEPSAYYVGPCLSCPSASTKRHENYVTVVVDDDVSTSGHVDIAWTGEGDAYFVVCGSTDTPQPVPPNTELTVYPWGHPGTKCPGGFSTSGTVTLTFSAKP